jgi:hypothetical protein
MSPPRDSERRAAPAPNGRGSSPEDAQGVLSKLPRTRPQRSSARRAAARDAAAAAGAASSAPARSNGHAPARPATTSARAPERASKQRSPAKPPRGPSKRATARNGSAKAAAARGSSAKAATTRGSTATRGGAAPRARKARADAANAAAQVEPAPMQGFECEGERNSSSVRPPGGAELVASAAEIVSELARAGLSSGERLVKDVLSRLPL